MPRTLPPQKQYVATGVDISMVNMSTPRAGRVQPLKDAPCVNHFLGPHECLARKCLYRHDASNEKALPWGLQWFTRLGCGAEMEHMNGPHGSIYLDLSHHLRIQQAVGHAIEVRTMDA